MSSLNRITGRSAFISLLKDEGVTHLFERTEDRPALFPRCPQGEVGGGHGWAGAVVDFLDVLEGKKPNPIPARFGAKTVAVCDAAFRSMASGKPERPEEF